MSSEASTTHWGTLKREKKKKMSDDELFEFQVLLGLIITNGPGTISAQGSKGAVSADGPEMPDRVQVNKAFIGFLTHTGFAHGVFNKSDESRIAFMFSLDGQDDITDIRL